MKIKGLTGKEKGEKGGQGEQEGNEEKIRGSCAPGSFQKSAFMPIGDTSKTITKKVEPLWT